ncbi:LOW QUALITY PROTEIN: ABC transporter C family member 13 [Dioscorea cayenensis subsp. rotundata]|uniref:ABC-type xenobiotic transporter n=1 Tax=Dioscorea cayennensis subsp. rotundata TaxID=55577 RepID=A0AB40AZC2_DIOCR|nr:LOW QUALITY PROTEIN: ABC transporter C family member 13 [Dioscorea cayenensis subsp. rotundata]
MGSICSKVLDGNGFSFCFEDMVFGFGGNVVTVGLLIVLWVTQRNASRSTVRSLRLGLLEKVLLNILLALGTILSFYEMLTLVGKSMPDYHEWFYRSSQLASWISIMLVSKFSCWFPLLCNPFFCCWWIVKPITGIPRLYTAFSSLKTITCFKESSSVTAEILFTLFINITRIAKAPTEESKYDLLEGPLLSYDTKEEHHVSDLVTRAAQYWHMLTFQFVNPMMSLGVTKQLDLEDLVSLPLDLMPSPCHDTFLRCWVAEEHKNQSKSLLFRVICKAYGWPYLRLGLLKVLNDSLSFLSPLLLNRLIKFLQQGSGNIDGYTLAILMGLVSTIKSFLDTQYTFHLSKLKLKLRSSIMTIIYHKCLYTSLAARSKFSNGEVQTFMSVDADRTINMCNSFHDMWSLPLQIGVALCLLYTQVNYAFLSGFALTVLLIPVNKWISTKIASATQEMMKHKDERVRSVGEILTYVRTLKMYNWENMFTDRIMERRTKEVKQLSTRKYLDAWCVFFWATTPTLFSLFTFGVFTLMGHPLDAATVFTCVALFNTLISPLNSFPWVINGLIDAIISAGRLSKFLTCPEIDSDSGHIFETNLQTSGSLQPPCEDNADTDSSAAVVFHDLFSVWSSGNEDGEQNAVLNGITLNLPKGLFIAIVGEVGSGKSSLLNSILGEMCRIHGSVHSHGSIAYVPQVPWILSGSVRDNILFGEAFDARRYREVLHSCGLDVDISRMVGGDLAYIGEKGINLSGGQRARIALARAVYHESDVYLLDDVLSAVDSQVACWILEKTMLSSLMNQKTRALCTHNLQAISAADVVVVLDKGHVKWAGSSADFLLSPYSTISTIRDSKLASPQKLGKEISINDPGESDVLWEDDILSTAVEEEDASVLELRKEGRVELSVYKSYARFSGWHIVIVTCVSAAFMQSSRNGNDLWLSHWVDAAGETESITFYLVGLCIFGIVNSLLTLVRAFSFAYGGLHAAVQVHTELLSKIVDAPVHFFDQNPSGRILNRLSSDLYMIDDSLPFILNILLANFFSLLGIVVVLSYAQILFLLLLLPLWYLFSKLQYYYRSTSRELRRLDSVSRSPIYSSFTETLDGSSTIRAFKAEELFMGRFIEHMTRYQRTSYSEISASLWLSLRLQLLAAVVISFIAVMAIIGRQSDFILTFGTPGLVGLALSYAAPVVSLLSSFLTSFAETEKEMVSVERVLQYMDIPQEEHAGSQSPPPGWPLEGRIEFDHVTLRYMPSLPPALNEVSFNIEPGMQVGIVGRTGAGKSSVINALFRLSPICNGWILVDGLNVANVAVGDLRRAFAVVPQSPFLFEGSLRDNLDPCGKSDDCKIWEILEKCHLKTLLESAGGLDTHVKENGITFSVGQRQLICLARALIKSSKILCLDECTASVDTKTASILQKTISSVCKGMTVLTIAHRISIVLNMDNVLVLEHGILVEQGNPQELVKDPNSMFASFARASTM